MKLSLFVANNHSTWVNISEIASVAEHCRWHAL